MKFLLLLGLLAGLSAAAFAEDCSKRNTSCSHCVSSFDCYWCKADSSINVSACMKRASYNLHADCSGTYYLYPSCSISGLATMIIVIVICVIIVILITCCVYCCCCRTGKSTRLKWAKEDERDRQARQDRRERQESRRSERKARNDEIRKKYGLYRDDQGADGRYQRFDV